MDHCSFCSRPRNEVKKLYMPLNGGPAICNKCLKEANKDDALTDEAKPSAKSTDFLLKTPREMYAYLQEHVIAQDDAKKMMSVAVYNHYKRRDALRKGVQLEVTIDKSNVLLMGPSGCGKTQIARSLARMLKVPFYVADATKLTSAGYVGDDVESLIQGILAECNGDVDKAQWGICFLDEFDKLARKSGRNASGYRDVSGEGVQQALLKIIEGSKIAVPRGHARSGQGGEADLVDTTNILFICAGSFAGIEEVVSARSNKDVRVGFGSERRKELDAKEVFTQVTEEDILEFGIIPELLGRIPVHTSVYPLTEDEMVQILTEPKDSLVKQYQALFQMDGIQLEFTEGALRAIGREANRRPTGARALRTIVAGFLDKYTYELAGRRDVERVIVTEETAATGKAEVVISAKVATA